MPITGIVVVEDVYLSRSLLVLAAPFQYIGICVPYIEPTTANGDQVSPEESSQTEQSRVSYIPQLPVPAYKPPNDLILQVTPLSDTRVVFQNNLKPGDMEENDLKVLCEKAAYVRHKAHALARGALMK